MYIDEFTGGKYAKGQMTWLIGKGERLPESFPKKASISVSMSFKKGESREIGGVLVGCDAETAPQRYRDDCKGPYQNFHLLINLTDHISCLQYLPCIRGPQSHPGFQIYEVSKWRQRRRVLCGRVAAGSHVQWREHPLEAHFRSRRVWNCHSFVRQVGGHWTCGLREPRGEIPVGSGLRELVLFCALCQAPICACLQ